MGSGERTHRKGSLQAGGPDESLISLALRLLLLTPGLVVLSFALPLQWFLIVLPIALLPGIETASWGIFLVYIATEATGIQEPLPVGVYFVLLPVVGGQLERLTRKVRPTLEWALWFGGFLTVILVASAALILSPALMPRWILPVLTGLMGLVLAGLTGRRNVERAVGFVKARLVLGSDYRATEGPGVLSLESRGVPVKREVVIELRTPPIADYIAVYSNRELKRLPRVYESELNGTRYVVYSSEMLREV